MKTNNIFILLLISFAVIFLPVSCNDDSAPGVDNHEKKSVPIVIDCSAEEFVRNLKIGVNIGNSLDSIGTKTWTAGETGWGNPLITQAFVKSLKTHGYTTVRLPVTWAENMGPAPDYKIKESWMKRVETVVDWILDEGLYCILNIHHDGGDADKSWILGAASNPDGVSNQLSKVWTQIANRFNYANEYLIMETMNEVGFDSQNTTQRYATFNRLNQTAVDAIRATGKNNALRFILVAGYWTDIEKTCHANFEMPQDIIEDRLILSVHYYTPATFCIAEEVNNSWGFRSTWGNTSDYTELNNNFNLLKTNFTSKGIPVILGEYGVALKNKDEASRIEWMRAVTQKCLDEGICPVLWDTGSEIRRTSPLTMRHTLQQVWAALDIPN